MTKASLKLRPIPLVGAAMGAIAGGVFNSSSSEPEPIGVLRAFFLETRWRTPAGNSDMVMQMEGVCQ